MLKIDYDPKTQYAKIVGNFEIDDLAWADIRRVCEERSSQPIKQGTRSLFLHWSDFLKLRSNILYIINNIYISNNNLNVEFGPEAETLLLRAKAHEDIFSNIDNLKNIDIDELYNQLQKIGFARKLTYEQARNVSFLIKLPAAATFSVPGAGKTTEALAYYSLKRESDTKLIVVSPKNAFAVWEEEINVCLPKLNLSVVRLQGGENGVQNALSQNPSVSLITYQQFSNVYKLVGEFLSKNQCFMFLDESHRMKRGYLGVYGSSILNVSFIPECKLLLSGTPMPNRVEDLIPQFDFLYPEIKININNVENNIKKIYVRTTKPELGLEPPIRINHSIDMNPAQYKLYKNIRSEVARQIEGLTINEIIRLRSINKSIIRLLQVTSDPALLIETELSDNRLLLDAISEGKGAKVREACNLARKLASEGKKCIIWSQFIEIIKYVAANLKDLGAEFIYGAVETDDDEENTESREYKIKRFHDDPNCKVLVANPAACSEGISLHKVCHHAIYVDRNYNAAQYLQSEDRIHRLGLDPSEKTFIIIISCPNSIDDSVARRLQYKVTNMGRVLNDNSLNIEPLHVIDEQTGLSREDIEDIKNILLGSD